MQGNIIRERFLKFYESNNHKIVSSSPLLPIDDDTLLFANAGMNQFKNIFLGKEVRDYKRATTCQKVVRAGGKHNDLENVGRTARHHTFFEMLGNFSFGDYFKVDAIKFAWSFLTEELKLDTSKMFVTIYEEDDEAHGIWKDVIGLPVDKIHRRGKKDNFWQMGDTGPCGPCSEIFYDQGKGVGCNTPECDPECECDRHLEIWNLVFMQYNRDEKGEMTPLPKPSIDTGMGLERVAGIMQNVVSNYDTDLIKPIIEFIANDIGIKYGSNELNDVSMRVIADHSRATAFLIGDGVIPSSDGRGYVLRRIMRRAMRHGRLLGYENIFFYKVVLFVIDFMKGYYTELADKKEYIKGTVEKEERSFIKTLSSGLEILNSDIIPRSKTKGVIVGDDIFKLYDTYGFPVDLLEDIATDNNLSLDLVRFDTLMQEQQERAKAGGLGVKLDRVLDIFTTLGSKYQSEFLGYRESDFDNKGKVICIVNGEKEVATITAQDKAFLIFDKTSFYPEGGGQTGDVGSITADGIEFEVDDTFKVGDAIIHSGHLKKGMIEIGKELDQNINNDRRLKTEYNHTATHLLHKALQSTLGATVRQAGSNVDDESFRFDFTFDRALTDVEIESIEQQVNSEIFTSHKVVKEYMNKEEAIKTGATALFGERYSDTVRVVTIGDYSTELCGGCHIENTSEIGVFKIILEQSVASGVRRIEGLTSYKALAYLNDADRLRKDLLQLLKTQDIVKRVNDIFLELKSKDRNIRDLESKLVSINAEDMLSDIKTVNGINYITLRMDDSSIDNMRSLLDKAKQKVGSGIVIMAGVSDSKGVLLIGVTKDITSKINANDIIKKANTITVVKGGGRPEMAQAGVDDVSKIDELLNSLIDII